MIYLIRAIDTSFVKVGHGQDPDQRLILLQTGCPFELELVATREGGMHLEQSIHAQIEAFRHRGEWFHEVAAVHDAFHNTPADTGCGCMGCFIRTLGTGEEIARAIGKGGSQVRQWMKLHSVPDRHVPALINLAVSKGVSVPADLTGLAA